MFNFSIAVVPSASGFGHLRRCFALSKELVLNGFDVSLFWDLRVDLPEWAIVFLKSNRITLEKKILPLHLDAPHVFQPADKMAMRSLNFSKFDCVIADTVTWPLHLSNKSILIAQFTWKIYKDRLNLSNCDSTVPASTKIFGMKEYLWSEMRSYKNLTEIPILDYWGLSKKQYKLDSQLVFSQSGRLKYIPQSLSNLVKTDLKIVQGLENFVKEFRIKPLGVICRAGLGALSECLSLRTMPIFLPDEDFEIQFNVGQTTRMGIGFKVEDLLNLSQIELVSTVLARYNDAQWPPTMTVERFVRDRLMEEF
jgi:hypothetical protein